MLKRKKKEKIKQKVPYKAILAGILLAIGLLTGIGLFVLNIYEDSVLDIYAEQQDAYVQLVLDQINLQPNRSDEEIVNNILGTLDASNNKYWTLSREQTLLFVKDVTETNRYKGFTMPTFYSSQSASGFSEQLEMNHVKHEVIDMDNEQYVASGVIFVYNNAEYRICLLTNETFIKDNNDFLSAKIGLSIYLCVLLVLLMLSALILSHKLWDKILEVLKLQAKTVKLNKMLEGMEEELAFMDRFDTRWNLFERDTMDIFVKKLDDRGICPVAFLKLTFSDRKGRKAFFEKAQVLLDQKVGRFKGKGNVVYLVFVQFSRAEAERALIHLKQGTMTIERKFFYELREDSLWNYYQEFLRESEEEDEE